MSQPHAVATAAAPAAIGPYSQAIVAGDFVFISGQLPLDAATMAMPEGIEAQASLVLKNLEAVARGAGASLADAVKLTVYLTDLAHFPAVNGVMASVLGRPYPARATVGVAALPRNAMVEIDATLLRRRGD